MAISVLNAHFFLPVSSSIAWRSPSSEPTNAMPSSTTTDDFRILQFHKTKRRSSFVPSSALVLPFWAASPRCLGQSAKSCWQKKKIKKTHGFAAFRNNQLCQCFHFKLSF